MSVGIRQNGAMVDFCAFFRRVVSGRIVNAINLGVLVLKPKPRCNAQVASVLTVASNAKSKPFHFEGAVSIPIFGCD